MPFYSQEKIDEVNQAADLVELVSHYVALKRTGSVYAGLCPFHTEKTPSFKVTPQRHLFHCFGCGAGGGAIRFLMLIENLSFPEAVEELARRYGVDLPTADQAAEPGGGHKTALYEALRAAQKFYADRLRSDEGAAARRYLAGRGLTSAVTQAFGLGLAPAGWEALRRHLQALGFGDQAAVQAGLIRPGRETGRFYDFFRGRLMVPITDAQGRVAAFGGRLLPGADEARAGGKYINTGGTPVYTKGHLLFGQHRARPFIRAAGLAYLVEGYFDLISLAAAGVNEVVAALGTAVTDRQIKLLKGLTGRVFLLFDGDAAGLEVPVKNLPAFLNADLEARVVRLPAGHDPDSFIREFGAEALTELSAGAVDIFEFWVECLKKTTPDSGGVNAQFSRLDKARDLLEKLPDPAKRQIVRRRLAGLLGIDENALKGESRPGAVPWRPPGRAGAGESPAVPPADETALALLTLILGHPETAGPVLTQMGAYWPDDASRRLFDRLKAAYESGGAEAVSAAAARCDDLPPPLPNLAARAALEPQAQPLGQAEAAARDYMERLKGKLRRRRQAELSAAIARAQAAGDEAEIRRLQDEKKYLPDR